MPVHEVGTYPAAGNPAQVATTPPAPVLAVPPPSSQSRQSGLLVRVAARAHTPQGSRSPSRGPESRTPSVQPSASVAGSMEMPVAPGYTGSRSNVPVILPPRQNVYSIPGPRPAYQAPIAVSGGSTPQYPPQPQARQPSPQALSRQPAPPSGTPVRALSPQPRQFPTWGSPARIARPGPAGQVPSGGYSPVGSFVGSSLPPACPPQPRSMSRGGAPRSLSPQPGHVPVVAGGQRSMTPSVHWIAPPVGRCFAGGSAVAVPSEGRASPSQVSPHLAAVVLSQVPTPQGTSCRRTQARSPSPRPEASHVSTPIFPAAWKFDGMAAPRKAPMVVYS